MLGALILLLCWGSFALSFFFAAFAIIKDHKYFWWAALSSYVFSFFAAWSIGLFTLVFTFIFLVFAAGFTFGWFKKRRYSVAAVPIGVLLWYLAFKNIDDYYLFYPFQLFA
ncbi:hypothetical protein EV586_10852 [Tumebacillus sp. BK434]|uniref:hypothetical protein n=1 Tax=Tumebacillus sp. BK434 TaxID=2512169 RepID=UPI00104C9409|nr:hypothetical protein [Tumebacillus sp. BK434]TCP52678.1 hypothetical protein EV586_10852 [Tumebacillus sp. BK434]